MNNLKQLLQRMIQDHEVQSFENLKVDYPEFFRDMLLVGIDDGDDLVLEAFNDKQEAFKILLRESTRALFDKPSPDAADKLLRALGKQVVEVFEDWALDTFKRLDLDVFGVTRDRVIPFPITVKRGKTA